MAHALQASKAKRGEDAVTYSDRIMKSYKKPIDVSYRGKTSKVENAEKMAEALSWGFVNGKSSHMDVVKHVRKKKR